MCSIFTYQNINDHRYKGKKYYSALNGLSRINVIILVFQFIK